MERAYLTLLNDILNHGVQKNDRTKTGTYSLFAQHLSCDLNDGFPLMTTKRMFWKGIVAELLWFLQGSDNNTDLRAQGVHIWDEWADEQGNLGPIYGVQWRRWKRWVMTERAFSSGHPVLRFDEIDQIFDVQNALRNNPDSRRHLVNAWNVADLDQMRLPPCHVLFQFYSRPLTSEGEVRALDCQMYQRSADAFLGLPFNIASYALLTHMMAQCTSHVPGRLTITLGDVHVYSNHLDQVDEQLQRSPLPAPILSLGPVYDIDGFTRSDINLHDYEAHPAITAPVAV